MGGAQYPPSPSKLDASKTKKPSLTKKGQLLPKIQQLANAGTSRKGA
jgi:hypothetical protein